MVRELLEKLSDHLSQNAGPEDDAPRMFARSSEVPPPMPHLRHGEQISRLHSEWIVRIVPPARPSGGQRAIRVIRRVANRAGSVDREIVADLIRAIDALASRCDELADRLEHQQIVVDDAVSIFGEELTRLRAASLDAAGSGENSPSLPHE
jgi:hypothetical protein